MEHSHSASYAAAGVKNIHIPHHMLRPVLTSKPAMKVCA